MTKDFIKNLPGYNCGACGYRNCNEFSVDLAAQNVVLEQCPHLKTEKFSSNLSNLKKQCHSGNNNITIKKAKMKQPSDTTSGENIVGVIDRISADFVLAPLLGETSCREDIYPFNQAIVGDLKVSMHIKYRPLGCPVMHFAKIIDLHHGILTIHLVGPQHLFAKEANIIFKDIGVCMVAAFLGRVVKGRIPAVCETIKFLPEHCMMQKVHAGVVVYAENDIVRIEGIDLKVTN